MPPATRGKKVNYKLADEWSEDEPDEDIKPKPKRAKISRKDSSFVSSEGTPRNLSTKAPTRPRGGKLRNLMLMPVDIFVEICQYLGPKDLRALSLTVQSLRKILMSRDSKHIWKSSLLGVPDLPECPVDLTEPQYVRLLFSSECYDCGTHCGLYDFYHRVLFCDRCFHVHMVGLHYAYGKGFMTADLMVLYSSSKSFNPCRTGKRQRLTWCMDSLDLAQVEYQVVKSSPELLEKFTTDAQDTHNMRLRTGSAITKWKSSVTLAKRTVQDESKDMHQKNVEDKLLLLGWQKDDFPTFQAPYNSLVRKPKKLTEKAWETMLPKLVPILEESKRERLAKEVTVRQICRQRDLHQRYRDLLKDEFHPPSINGSYGDLPGLDKFIQVPEIRGLINDDSNPIITDRLWLDVVDVVRTWTLRHRWNLLNSLTRIPEGGGEVPETSVTEAPETAEELLSRTVEMESQLSLATSAFSCCDAMHWFPTVLEHHRLHHGTYYKLETKLASGRQLISAMLRDLGEDPQLATREQLTNYGHTFLCTRCDARTTSPRKIDELLKHYLEADTWYSRAKGSFKSADHAELCNTHDWTRDSPVLRMEDESQREVGEELRREFEASETTPVEGLPDGEAALKRTCTLCPPGYALAHRSWARIKIHIETVHGKVPDVLAHSNAVHGWVHVHNQCPVL